MGPDWVTRMAKPQSSRMAGPQLQNAYCCELSNSRKPMDILQLWGHIRGNGTPPSQISGASS